MVARRALSCIALLAGLVCAPAMAQESGILDTVESMEARDKWYAKQAVVLSALRVDVERNQGQERFWLITERTPNGRIRVLKKDTPEGDTRMTFLVQGSTTMVIAGNDVGLPPAAWMLGHYLFGQAMEPGMLMSWSMGLPGKDYRLGAAEASVAIDGAQVTRIEQDGWTVEFAAWTEGQGEEPARPRVLRLQGSSGVAATVAVAQVVAHETTPQDYNEFKIM